MATTPGWIPLLDAVRCCGLNEDKFTRQDAIAVWEQMVSRGWVILPEGPGLGVSRRERMVTVFTCLSGEDQVSEVINEIGLNPNFPGLSYQHVGLGEFSVRAPAETLNELAMRLRAITGVRVQW